MILLKNNVHRPYSGLATELEWTCAHKSSDSGPNSVYKLSMSAAIYWLMEDWAGAFSIFLFFLFKHPFSFLSPFQWDFEAR
jgi:hypothetical protein